MEAVICQLWKDKKKTIALLHNKEEGGDLGHFKNDQISTP